MKNINSVDVGLIKNLRPGNLTVLLSKLLSIEANREALEISEISVPEDINVPDGGEDGRIEWINGPKRTKWLNNRLALFQCKATNLSKGACYKEILEEREKGKPLKMKSQVEDVFKRKGSYNLFTTQALTKKQIRERIEQFKLAAKDAGFPNSESLSIEIYDANKIKDWTNENIGAITFVQSCNDITRPFNFTTWKEWERDIQASKIPYKTNEKILNHIKQIRTELEEKKVVRIIGQSGLGKTRLALEAFRNEGNDPVILAQQSEVVYYDIGIGNLSELRRYIISHRLFQSGILIIDNCSESQHSELIQLIKSAGNFKIITIDYDNNTKERAVIKLDRHDQGDIVNLIVDDRFKDALSMSDKEYIAKRSEGYPQMAIMFCDLVSERGIENLTGIIPEELLKKLVFGRLPYNEVEFTVIKGCASLASFSFMDDSFRDALSKEEKDFITRQTNYVRTVICDKIGGVEISEREFYRICKSFKENSKILEQRGTKIMVKPTPLAISLAAQWWRNMPADEIKRILTDLKDDDLGMKLIERLSQLDQLYEAKNFVNELWGPYSPFGDAEVLKTSMGSLLFRYVVDVNPIATVNALYIAFGDMTTKELRLIREARRNLVWALEKLCFRKETFDIASKLLFSFAVAENESWGNNSRNQFIQLFQSFLPGTMASYGERIKILEWGLNHHDDEFTRIAILAMGRAIKNDHMHRMGGPENQGSSIPLQDYHPKSWRELYEYWNSNIKMLVEIAKLDTNFRMLAISQFTDTIRNLIRDGQFDLVESASREIVKVDEQIWAEIIFKLSKTLSYELTLDSKTKLKIKKLIGELTPNDIKSELLIKVTKGQISTNVAEDAGAYIDYAALNAEELAKKYISGNISFFEYVPELLKGVQSQAFNFGKKIGELSTEVEKYLHESVLKLRELETKDQNPEFIAGLLRGKNNYEITKNIVELFITDPVLQHLSFYLIRVVDIRYEFLLKLFPLINSNGVEIAQFENFKYGRALDALAIDEVLNLCFKISEYGKTGKWTALTLLYMYSHDDIEKWKSVRHLMREIIMSENLIIKSSGIHTMDAYHWSDAIEKILKEEHDYEFAIEVSKQIVEYCHIDNFSYSFDTYAANIVFILFDKYFDNIWNYFGKALIGDYAEYFHLKNLIGAHNGFPNNSVGILFMNKNNFKKLIEWIKEHKKVAPKRLASMMPLDSNDGKWNIFSKLIIDNYGDDIEVIRALDANMGTYGTVGSSIPYFETQSKLLKELTDHPRKLVSKWAKGKLISTEKRIRRENLSDEENLL